jgi:hypothetical protein
MRERGRQAHDIHHLAGPEHLHRFERGRSRQLRLMREKFAEQRGRTRIRSTIIFLSFREAIVSGVDGIGGAAGNPSSSGVSSEDDSAKSNDATAATRQSPSASLTSLQVRSATSGTVVSRQQPDNRTLSLQPIAGSMVSKKPGPIQFDDFIAAIPTLKTAPQMTRAERSNKHADIVHDLPLLAKGDQYTVFLTLLYLLPDYPRESLRRLTKAVPGLPWENRTKACSDLIEHTGKHWESSTDKTSPGQMTPDSFSETLTGVVKFALPSVPEPDRRDLANAIVSASDIYPDDVCCHILVGTAMHLPEMSADDTANVISEIEKKGERLTEPGQRLAISQALDAAKIKNGPWSRRAASA